MNGWLKTVAIAAGLMIVGMVAAASADAGNKHRHHGFHGGYYSKHFGRHGGYRKHYGYRKHRRYGKFYRYHRYNRFGHYRHGFRKHHYGYHRGYRRSYLGFSYVFRHAPYAYQRYPDYRRRTVAVRERTVVRDAVPVTRQAPATAACLQKREYQTTITVGGKQVNGYGTACLQPDGSWRRGPARATPTFD